MTEGSASRRSKLPLAAADSGRPVSVVFVVVVVGVVVATVAGAVVDELAGAGSGAVWAKAVPVEERITAARSAASRLIMVSCRRRSLDVARLNYGKLKTLNALRKIVSAALARVL